MLRRSIIGLLLLLFALPAPARDYSWASIQKRGDFVLIVTLPTKEPNMGKRPRFEDYQLICEGFYSQTRETGYDCHEAIPLPLPPALRGGKHHLEFSMNVPDDVY